MKISGLSILCEVVRSPLNKFPLVAEIRNNTTDTELATTNTDMAQLFFLLYQLYFQKGLTFPRCLYLQGFPTSESLSTSAFREFCGEWGKKWITRIAKPHSDQGQRTDPPFCNKTIFLSFSLSFQNKSLSLRYRLLVPKGKAGGLILEKNLRPQFHTKN